MSVEQAHAFRTFVNENESVQHKFREVAREENWNLPSLAAEHGYTFTAQEAQSAWDQEKEGELTDFELEVVGCSGGKGGDTAQAPASLSARLVRPPRNVDPCMESAHPGSGGHQGDC